MVAILVMVLTMLVVVTGLKVIVEILNFSIICGGKICFTEPDFFVVGDSLIMNTIGTLVSIDNLLILKIVTTFDVEILLSIFKRCFYSQIHLHLNVLN